MNIRIDNTHFSGRLNFFSMLSKKKVKIIPEQHADIFIHTIPDTSIDIRSIKKGAFLNQGKDASVYRTNNDDYVLRIIRYNDYVPECLQPLLDGNGLIVAANSHNTVQLQKYVKGKPLYEKDWDICYSTIDKDEYLETFKKIYELPDESFVEYIRKIIEFRKCGYDTDSVNPNNILLDGTHLNIVDIEKKETVVPDIYVTDFYPLVNLLHIRNIVPKMNNEEVHKFAGEVTSLLSRIIDIAKKEGYIVDDKKITDFSNIVKWKVNM